MEGPVNTQEAAPTGRPFSWVLVGLWCAGLATTAGLLALTYHRVRSGYLYDTHYLVADPFSVMLLIGPIIIIGVSLWAIPKWTGVRASIALCVVQWTFYMVSALAMVTPPLLFLDTLQPALYSQPKLPFEAIWLIAMLGVIAALLSLALIPLMVVGARKAARGTPAP